MCEPEDRLGRENAGQIKRHPFFAGVNFDSLRRIAAPFKPHLASETDTAYFPSEEELARNAAQMAAANNPKGATAAGSTAGAASAATSGPLSASGTVFADAPEMTLPFIGYTFKRFEDNLGSLH